jgi:lipopolysaccharide/colanic/teichoic acid biosynthesis glycosyltransferase
VTLLSASTLSTRTPSAGTRSTRSLTTRTRSASTLSASTLSTRTRSYLKVKRVVDVLACLVVLPVVGPLLVLCALAVRLDTPGPVVFSQLRTGRNGDRFRMWKFRTMVRDAEELKATLAHLNVLPPPDFKIPDDPRITRVGRLLRATSLDELPQLLNVLGGDMSLVGPRPTSFAPQTYSLWHTARLEVTPGLTGLWQVRARGVCTFDERLRMDIEYIRSLGPVTDLKILLWTVAAMFRRSGL